MRAHGGLPPGHPPRPDPASRREARSLPSAPPRGPRPACRGRPSSRDGRGYRRLPRERCAPVCPTTAGSPADPWARGSAPRACRPATPRAWDRCLRPRRAGSARRAQRARTTTPSRARAALRHLPASRPRPRWRVQPHRGPPRRRSRDRAPSRACESRPHSRQPTSAYAACWHSTQDARRRAPGLHPGRPRSSPALRHRRTAARSPAQYGCRESRAAPHCARSGWHGAAQAGPARSRTAMQARAQRAAHTSRAAAHRSRTPAARSSGWHGNPAPDRSARRATRAGMPTAPASAGWPAHRAATPADSRAGRSAPRRSRAALRGSRWRHAPRATSNARPDRLHAGQRRPAAYAPHPRWRPAGSRGCVRPAAAPAGDSGP